MENGEIIVIIFLLIGMIIVLLFVSIRPPQMERCLERGLEKRCINFERGCYDDCNNFGLEYFRYDRGGFASDECWCKLNNETKQIW